jgi:hypothetical protein
LDPDELTRLLTQAVEPIRPDPAAYQRIKEGVAWRRRWRAPGFALAGIAAAALVVLAVLAVQPGPSARVVEPATPILSSLGGGGSPGASATYRNGSAGGSATDDPDDGPGSSPGGTRPPSTVTATPTAPQTPNPSSSTPPDGGSVSMPAPAAVPAANGDVDGDGSTDALRLAGSKLEVTMTRAGAVVAADVPNAVSPLAATVVDLDRDGFGEIVLQTGAAAGVKRYSVLRLAGMDGFEPVDADGGVPLVAGIDTLGGVAYGFRCAAGTLTTFAATTSDLGSTFLVVTTDWRLTGDVISQVDSNSPGTPTSDRSQFAVSCGDLR